MKLKSDIFFNCKSVIYVFLIIVSNNVHAQGLSGIINDYTEVTEISGSEITVASSANFFIGEKVLIMQMKGAEIDTTNSIDFGNILSYNNAGRYDYANILSIAGPVITISMSLCSDYDVMQNVQLISVPVYDDATIDGTLTAAAWNGVTGGVLAFEVTNTLTFNANIDVSGKGFSGGTLCLGFFTCVDTFYYSHYNVMTDCFSGQKGESISSVSEDYGGDRGKSANGGGGSTAGQDGGGGGGNFGTGGLSGFQTTHCAGYDNYHSYGGAALNYDSNHIYLGGGGGGGHADNGLDVTSGANGGGIVLITASTIDGTGDSIIANGNDVVGFANYESAGGGGAGGSVILRVNNIISDLHVELNGGDGGSIVDGFTTYECHGPGGGGGGGFLGISLPSLPAEIFIDAEGGAAGNTTSPGAFCDGTTNGAEPGESGGYLTGIPIEFMYAYPEINIGSDTGFCNAVDPFVLDAGPGYEEYLWSDGSSGETFFIDDFGEYAVTVTNNAGCSTTDSIAIMDFDEPVASFNMVDNDICMNDSAQFINNSSIATGSITSYLWDFDDGSFSTEGDPFHYYISPGIYNITLEATSDKGCFDSVTDNIFIFESPFIYAGYDDTTSYLSPYILHGLGEGAFLWTPLSPLVAPAYITDLTDPNTIVALTETTSFQLHLIAADGCSADDTVTLFVRQATEVNSLFYRNTFSVSPNPATDQITIGISNHVSGAGINSELNIYDMTGKIISRLELLSEETIIDISNYAAGIYFVKANINGAQSTQKLIIQ